MLNFQKQKENNIMSLLRQKSAIIFPAPIVNTLSRCYTKYKRFRMPEKKVSFGDLYPDRTFYLIRLYPPGTGFLANYIYILGYMHYAYKKGWIPVIDMKNYQTLYSDDGKTDLWGSFFEQPPDKYGHRYSLKEVYHSKNVVLSCGSEDFYDISFDNNPISCLKWQREMASLVPFNSEMLVIANKMYSRTVGNQDCPVIGIPFRGTDYNRHVAGHSKQLNPKVAFQFYEHYIKLWYPDNIKIAVYCNSEESSTINEAKQYFSNLLYSDTKRIELYDKKQNVADSIKEDSLSMLRDYLANMYVLSKCDSMIGTMNNGLYTSFIWSMGKYSHFKLIDLGKHK